MLRLCSSSNTYVGVWETQHQYSPSVIAPRPLKTRAIAHALASYREMSDSDSDPITYQFGLCCAACRHVVHTKQKAHRHLDVSCPKSNWWCGCCAKELHYGARMHHLNKKRVHLKLPAVDDATLVLLAAGAPPPPARPPVQGAAVAPPSVPLLPVPTVCAVDAATSPAMFSTATSAVAVPPAPVRSAGPTASPPTDLDLGLTDTDWDIILARYEQSLNPAQPPAPAAAPAAAASPPAAAGTPTTFDINNPIQHLYYVWLLHMDHLGLLHNQPVRRQQLHALTGAFRVAALSHHVDALSADMSDLVLRFGDLYEHWPGAQ